ncbi:barstar family protein [Streptomyces sp. NPDC048349]|uniref:barstar family protein n=1 Tax=Streptomyces sp. NPDC048349 TaxID=3155486 RepID=UPI00343D2539
MTDSELVVDLRGRLIATLNDFWDAVSEPCGLPEWFGRNLDAWSDMIETRGISEVIDSHDRHLFGGDRREANVLAGIVDREQNRLVVHGLT